jgi:hypothetical protein
MGIGYSISLSKAAEEEWSDCNPVELFFSGGRRQRQCRRGGVVWLALGVGSEIVALGVLGKVRWQSPRYVMLVFRLINCSTLLDCAAIFLFNLTVNAGSFGLTLVQGLAVLHQGPRPGVGFEHI